MKEITGMKKSLSIYIKNNKIWQSRRDSIWNVITIHN